MEKLNEWTPESKAEFNKKADKFKRAINECTTYGTLIHVDFKNKELLSIDKSQEEEYTLDLDWEA